MTRINTVFPSHLSDKHLLAEYRELPRIFTAVEKLVQSRVSSSSVETPPAYCLGGGHVKFFYNKIGWLRRRYQSLVSELVRRGVNINMEQVRSIGDAAGRIPGEWQGDWTPTPQDHYLNMVRLVIRSPDVRVQAELRTVILENTQYAGDFAQPPPP